MTKKAALTERLFLYLKNQKNHNDTLCNPMS